MALYALATVLFLPGSVLTLAAGALFGVLPGALYSVAGATLGAVLAFLVARHLAGDWVARKAGGRPWPATRRRSATACWRWLW